MKLMSVTEETSHWSSGWLKSPVSQNLRTAGEPRAALVVAQLGEGYRWLPEIHRVRFPMDGVSFVRGTRCVSVPLGFDLLDPR